MTEAVARYDLEPNARSILLIRLRSLGDAVLMTTLVAALRQARPNLRIDALLEQPAADLLYGHPALTTVVSVGRSITARLSTLRILRRQRYDIAIDLHGGPTASLLCRWSGARRRIGLDAYRHPRAYNVVLAAPFKRASREHALHTVESNLALARALGLTPADNIVPSLQATSRSERLAYAALEQVGCHERPFIAIHPGAALASKTWPLPRFHEVAGRLQSTYQMAVVVIRPPNTRPSMDLPVGVVELESISVATLFAVLQRATALVCNDSGPAHMAAAAGIPTIAVFGSQDPRVWRPWGDHAQAISSDLPCSPCRGFTCDNSNTFECLTSITTDRVFDVVQQTIGRTRSGHAELGPS